MAPLLKPLKIEKGDYVYQSGDLIDGVYFIRQGEAAYVEKGSLFDLIYCSALEGSYFGDVDFVTEGVFEESN